MARFQRGSLRIESRKNGDTWVLRYFATRDADGRRVEHTLSVGLVRDFPSESAVWAEVEREHLNHQINQPGFRGRLSFADLAHHYMRNELSEHADTVDPKARTTIYIYRHIFTYEPEHDRYISLLDLYRDTQTVWPVRAPTAMHECGFPMPGHPSARTGTAARTGLGQNA